MLDIRNLRVTIQDDKQKAKEILRGLSLQMAAGTVHAVMGPNGSGKSTLANVLAGNPSYQVTAGELRFRDKDLLSLSPEERALQGVFLAFQYPVEIPGVNNTYFLRTAVNNLRKQQHLKQLDALDFLSLIKNKIREVGLDEAFLNRAVNEGFSGGEKKRNEILQMLVLEPQLIILDEIDSGLDIDALQMIARCVNSLREKGRSVLIVTHYQRLLDYIVPDAVHVMSAGRIIRSGDKELARELESRGYGWIEKETVL